MISVLRLLIGILLSFLFLLSPLLAVTPDELPESSPESSHSSDSPYNEKSEPVSKTPDLQAFWPLQEGQGDLVHDTNGRYHGLLRTLQDGVAPTWGYKNGESALLFSGGKSGGRVEVHRGGAILYGTRFRISLEIAPFDRNSRGMLLTCKHATSTGGGFSLFYWGGQKKIIFSIADGEKIHKFEVDLEKKLQPGHWTPVEILYSESHLSIKAAKKNQKILNAHGLYMRKSTYPLLIGGYYNDLGVGFHGRIRNVALSMPAMKQTISSKLDTSVRFDRKTRPDFISRIKKISKRILLATETPELIPHDETIKIANNMVVPNWFKIGSSGRKVLKLNTTYYLDIPNNIQLLHIGTIDKASGGISASSFSYKKIETIEHDGEQYTRFLVKPRKMHQKARAFGPVYLRSLSPDMTESYLYYSAAWDDGGQGLQRIKVLTRTFPTPGRPKKIHTSVGWMLAIHGKSWPGFLDIYGKLGFNTVPTHGLYDRRLGGLRYDFIKEARYRGYKILYVDSSFHPIKKDKEASSISPDGAEGHDLCPAYRGKFYKEEIERVAALAETLRPDYEIWDIECFKDGAIAGRTGLCKRCNEYIAKLGKSPREAITDLGAEIIQDVRRSIEKKIRPLGAAMPLTGLYHTKPRFVYQDIFDFDKMYQRGVDFCMPVFYDSRKRKWMGDSLRNIRRQMPRGDIIPWLQPGTIKDYPSPWIYDGVLESFGSGARGITWYAFTDMEGEDLFCFAKAMESIIQVEDIIYDSEPVEGVVSKNKKVNATAIRKGNEYLFLLSNYAQKTFKGEVTVILPQHITGTVWDLARKEEGGKIIKDKAIIDFEPGVQGGHTALYYIGEHTF